MTTGLASGRPAGGGSTQRPGEPSARQAASSPGPTGRAQRVGRIVGANLLVTGSYRVVRDSLAFTVELIDAATGEVARALGPIMGPLTDPSRTADRVRDRVLGAIAIASYAGGPAAPLAKIASAPSYPAYREFIRSKDLDNQGLNREAARVALRAYRMDTTSMLPLASVIGTAIDERPELLEDGRLGEVLSAMLIRYVKGSQGS